MMKRRYPHKKNVLLVNITRLGDMLQATPTIAGMKQENPDCKITVLVEKQFEDVCKIIPNIDEIIGLDLGMTVRSLAREREGILDAYEYVSEVVEDLKARNFDYCLNMSSSAYTAILLKLIGIERSGGWTSDEEGFRVIESDWARLFASSVFHQNRQFTGLNLVDVFRCSADVEQHPRTLVLNTKEEDSEWARQFIAESGMGTDGPLIAVQAGASQGKRQWLTGRFVQLVSLLVNQYGARVVLIGTKKELPIVEPIKAGVNSSRVVVAAGRTSVPQLAALLKESDLLVTGDTGPMHISVAVGTPVVSMFLASAYGYETGPYSEGNILLQPVISCGPCNPNKSCSRPDCHETITPELVAALSAARIKEDFRTLPSHLRSMVDPRSLIVYRTYFDEHGFYDLQELHEVPHDRWVRHRKAYRRMWIDDLAGLTGQAPQAPTRSGLSVAPEGLEGVEEVIRLGKEGSSLIHQLERLIEDRSAPGSSFGTLNLNLAKLDRHIEELGFHYPPLGPVTRMFVFAKENLAGTDAMALASQMGGIYKDLSRRCEKLAQYFHAM